MTIKTKPSSIFDFNSILDKDYQDLNKKREGWYPIMYYNEDVALENKKLHYYGYQSVFNN